MNESPLPPQPVFPQDPATPPEAAAWRHANAQLAAALAVAQLGAFVWDVST